ncbi:hypothetical protein BB561_005579 [Smittium simulii]|uniref:Uncharacterized protein n=1 Tax=Smittium simulii TaxID=133385 RepID=A0A2T9Y9Q2_9FUNG|nr:hypothetical protein BB561_005579 [Smittium simulii]
MSADSTVPIITPRKRRTVDSALEPSTESKNDSLKQYILDAKELSEKIMTYLLCWYGKTNVFKILQIDLDIHSFDSKYSGFISKADESTFEDLKEHQNLKYMLDLNTLHSETQSLRKNINNDNIIDILTTIQKQILKVKSIHQSHTDTKFTEIADLITMDLLKLKSLFAIKIDNLIEQTFEFTSDYNLEQLTVYNPQNNPSILNKNSRVIDIFHASSDIDSLLCTAETVLENFFQNIIYTLIRKNKVFVDCFYSHEKNWVKITDIANSNENNTLVFGEQDYAFVKIINGLPAFLIRHIEQILTKIRCLEKDLKSEILVPETVSLNANIIEMLYTIKLPTEIHEKIYTHIDVIEQYDEFATVLKTNKQFINHIYETLNYENLNLNIETTSSNNMIKSTFLKYNQVDVDYMDFFTKAYTFPLLLSKNCCLFLVAIFDFLEINKVDDNQDTESYVAKTDSTQQYFKCEDLERKGVGLRAPGLDYSIKYDCFPQLEMKKDKRVHKLSKLSIIHNVVQVFISIVSIIRQELDKEKLSNQLILYNDCVSVSRFIGLLPSFIGNEDHSILNRFDIEILRLQEFYNGYFEEIVKNSTIRVNEQLCAQIPEILNCAESISLIGAGLCQSVSTVMDILSTSKMYFEEFQFAILSSVLISTVSDTVWSIIATIEEEPTGSQVSDFKENLQAFACIKTLEKFLMKPELTDNSFYKVCNWLEKNF